MTRLPVSVQLTTTTEPVSVARPPLKAAPPGLTDEGLPSSLATYDFIARKRAIGERQKSSADEQSPTLNVPARSRSARASRAGPSHHPITCKCGVDNLSSGVQKKDCATAAFSTLTCVMKSRTRSPINLVARDGAFTHRDNASVAEKTTAESAATVSSGSRTPTATTTCGTIARKAASRS